MIVVWVITKFNGHEWQRHHNQWKTYILPSSSYQRFLQSAVLLSRRIKIQLQTLKKDFICKVIRLRMQRMCILEVKEIRAGGLLHIQMLKETVTAMSFDCEFTAYAFITEQ